VTKDGAVFGFSAPPMPYCPLLECLDNTLIKIPDGKLRHISPPFPSQE
jgi:hypothetical protein